LELCGLEKAFSPVPFRQQLHVRDATHLPRPMAQAQHALQGGQFPVDGGVGGLLRQASGRVRRTTTRTEMRS